MTPGRWGRAGLLSPKTAVCGRRWASPVGLVVDRWWAMPRASGSAPLPSRSCPTGSGRSRHSRRTRTRCPAESRTTVSFSGLIMVGTQDSIMLRRPRRCWAVAFAIQVAVLVTFSLPDRRVGKARSAASGSPGVRASRWRGQRDAPVVAGEHSAVRLHVADDEQARGGAGCRAGGHRAPCATPRSRGPPQCSPRRHASGGGAADGRLQSRRPAYRSGASVAAGG